MLRVMNLMRELPQALLIISIIVCKLLKYTSLYINAIHQGRNLIEEATWSIALIAITYSRSLGDS